MASAARAARPTGDRSDRAGYVREAARAAPGTPRYPPWAEDLLRHLWGGDTCLRPLPKVPRGIPLLTLLEEDIPEDAADCAKHGDDSRSKRLVTLADCSVVL